MWDADADKYWKEKLKAKRRQELLQKASGAACLALVLLVLYLRHAWAAEAAIKEAQRNASLAPPPPPPPPPGVLSECRAECRVKAVDVCNKACAFASSELPRPSIFRACQAPCMQVANSMCDIATHEQDKLRAQCRSSADNLSFQVCKEYEYVLPRPRTQTVCSVGTAAANQFACKSTASCIADRTVKVTAKQNTA
jgi:hypothetical protein